MNIMNVNECCVCKSDEIISNMYSGCPYDHKICKICYMSILQMCYCVNNLGTPVYKCPLCRNKHTLTSQEMNIMLLDLTKDNNMCIHVHKVCGRKNITQKCQFEECGCRNDIVNIYNTEEMDLAIKQLVEVTNRHY